MKIYVNIQSAEFFCQNFSNDTLLRSSYSIYNIFIQWNILCLKMLFLHVVYNQFSFFPLFHRSLEHPSLLMMSAYKYLWIIWRNSLSLVLPEILQCIEGTDKMQPYFSFFSLTLFHVFLDRMLWYAQAAWLGVKQCCFQRKALLSAKCFNVNCSL